MTLLQAILLGGYYWIDSVSLGHALYTLTSQPLCSSFFVGLIMGDLTTAVIVGATIQTMYLAATSAGGNIPVDKCAAGVVPTALVIASKGVVTIDQGLVIAVAAGLLFANLHTIKRIVNGVWVHIADRAAEKCNIKGIMLSGLLYPALFKIIIFWIPMTLIMYLGSDIITTLMGALPPFLMNGLEAAGKLMPAIGYGMIIYTIGRGDLMPYFIFGFFLAQFTGIGNIPLLLAACFVAFIEMRAKNEDGADLRKKAKQSESENSDGFVPVQRILTKKDIRKTWLLWWYNLEQSNSFERLQGLSFSVAISPILKKLYAREDQKEDLKEALRRSLLFFNTEGHFGAVIPGIVMSMEEQKALGEDIPGESITSIKTGLMGPMAGIGDTIDWALLPSLMLAFFIPMALEGKVWAAPTPALIVIAIQFVIGWNCMHLGYSLGSKAAVSMLHSGQIQRWLSFFSIAGLFMMGGLASSMVTPQLALMIPTADGVGISVQYRILDAILPGILSLTTVMGIYLYMKKGGNILKCTLALLLIGLVLGALGIIGVPPVPVA